MDSLKAAKLNRLFNAIVAGKQPLNDQNYLLFLESIWTAPEPVARFHPIVANSKALSTLQLSLWIDISPSFLNNAAAKLLQTMKSPSLASTSGGSHLRKLVQAIVDPPIFWDAFVGALQNNELEPDAQASFAWLLLQLLTLSPEMAKQYAPLANDPAIIGVLFKSSRPDIEDALKKIERAVAASIPSSVVGVQDAPGGRHSNDHSDFRDILILPTVDELAFTSKRTFLRPSNCLEDPKTEPNRVSIHLDNQFRLLREDMLHEMREELQFILGKKQGKHRGFVIEGLNLLDVYCKGSEERAKECNWALTFQCKSDLWQFKKCKNENDRRAYVKDNPRFLKHQSLTCLLVEGHVLAFPYIIRDQALLAKNPPILALRFHGKQCINALLQLPQAKNLKLIQIDTAIFSYEPVLTALQEKTSLPLDREILFFKEDMLLAPPTHYPFSVVASIRASPKQDLQPLLQTSKPIILDPAQAEALLGALSQRLALIQGPPGTGKSFVGALCAKFLLQQPDVKILVNCYTNHALDRFLEDLMDIGIPESDMVRIGGKSTMRTAPLSLVTLTRSSGARKTNVDWREIDALRFRQVELSGALTTAYTAYKQFNPQNETIMEHLRIDHPDYSAAFTVPASSDNSTVVGRGGKAVGPHYLLNRWSNGQDAGVYKDKPNVKGASKIWMMDRATRTSVYGAWKREMLEEQVEHIYDLGKQNDECVAQIASRFRSGEDLVLQSRRVIGCTTTGAAIYRELIQAARPSVLLVEEAGEILESHVLTALSDGVEHVILIGDHKQLRPKVNNYYLTVEKGQGFDLNRSLFERLVIKGYPHVQLKAQHRMRPEISRLIRKLTYPDLVDAPKAMNRPNIQGLQDNVILIHHEHPEGDVQAEEKRDMSSQTSKQNPFEVQMILKIIRYLGQQGYGTDKLVILTPYLGQLRAIMDALQKDNDPVLNDLDSYDLVRAGLMSQSAANTSKKQIRVATIDNYQGEESDIVVASLTRSNQNHDIGFMFSPERLNVLLSRARNGLIMIGNTHTFTKSPKGGELWTSLVNMLKNSKNLYDGLPVVCDRHPDQRSLLKTPEDFDRDCPDGGCSQPCGTKLKCGHACPSKCHQLADHSKMPCDKITNQKCPNGHAQQWKCSKGPSNSCGKCDRERELAEKQQQEQFALQAKRDAEEQAHARQMVELEAQVVREREKARAAREAEERKRALEQKRLDLQAAQAEARSAVLPNPSVSLKPTLSLPPVPPKPTAPPPTQGNSMLHSISNYLPSWAGLASPPNPTSSIQPNSSGKTPPTPKVMVQKPSAARDEWQYQKSVNGVQNPAIDAIMAMIGLEDVKKQVLSIKNKVDTSMRQGTDLKGERFNVSMLGNPGTGKTTVARHYARFLASVQIIPNDTFFETTGSRLANDGVPGIKAQVEKMLAAGGGTIFVDEAYQLTSDASGKRVLDFILAEMENNIGKLVWIFAGYNREMEKFFEHNPGLQSRVPYTLQFKDYEDGELLSMLKDLVEKQWRGRMKVEDGILGLYGRIAVRRLGRGRGRNGFGNARALRNVFDKIKERQSERLTKERRAGKCPYDFELIREDLIGPEPSTVIVQSKAWKALQSMIGLNSVKKSVKNLFDMTISNYQRELQELEPDAVSLNRVFLGSPGTGKTTVAKHYGQILAELGLLSNGEVVIKNPADFIGNVLGQSETNTKAILATTVGKVLIIDEAYMLYSGGPDKGGYTDSFKTAVIDTLVAEVQSVPGEDRCVLLLGYKDQMEEMFQNVNPGLARRFSIENAFHFHDYSDSELLQALDWKLRAQDRTATDEAKRVAIEVLGRLRIRPNFGNIGEVENLLSKAKTNYQDRQSALPPPQRDPNAPFEPQDFDPDFDRGKDAVSNLSKLFEDMIGSEEIIEKLRRWQKMAKVLKEKGMDMQNIPTNFVFKGPPGVGKTTVARKMGSVYYDMGILASSEVVECSASDLVGQYIGHTGPKTKKLFEKALGRVLFIDEAYRLGEGLFAQEAMDELVGILTHERFKGKIIVILAGYDQEINNLLQVNTGLSSRFPEEIVFKNITPDKCLEILDRKLQKQNVELPILRDTSSPTYAQLVSLVDQLSALPSWGNARDMETLAKKMIEIALSGDSATALGSLQLSAQDALSCFTTMLLQRRDRTTNRKRHSNRPGEQEALHSGPPPPSAPPSSQTSARTATGPPENDHGEPQKSTTDGIERDPGVQDDVWEQLLRDKEAAKDEQRRSEEKAAEVAKKERKAAEEIKRISNSLKKTSGDDRKMEELKRRREAARLRELQARAEKEAERKRREAESRAQTKLRQMGRCVAGYQWIKQASGYRCAGGSHFVGDRELGI